MQKPRLVLNRAVHREQEVMTLGFERNEEIITILRKLGGLRWSKTLNSWHVPYTPMVQSQLFVLLEGKAFIDYSALKKIVLNNVPLSHTAVLKKPQTVKHNPLPALNDHQREKLERFKNWMRSRRYSDSTIHTYSDALSVFLRYFKDKAFEQIDNEDLITFNNRYILANHCSASYQNQVVNAVKLFFGTMENRRMSVELIHRPKRAKVLPNVLSKEEVKLILTALPNIKHKTMLCLIYSCGLRRSELLNLKLADLDEGRGLLIIRHAKGKKDRITPLSPKIAGLLREYFAIYKPKRWIFEGQDGYNAYDESSLAQVLRQAVVKSGIQKPVTLHWLRHSYATHLLEAGTDLRYIQEILGHSRSTTTEIYTHVSTKSIQKVISPFDSL